MESNAKRILGHFDLLINYNSHSLAEPVAEVLSEIHRNGQIKELTDGLKKLIFGPDSGTRENTILDVSEEDLPLDAFLDHYMKLAFRYPSQVYTMLSQFGFKAQQPTATPPTPPANSGPSASVSPTPPAKLSRAYDQGFGSLDAQQYFEAYEEDLSQSSDEPLYDNDAIEGVVDKLYEEVFGMRDDPALDALDTNEHTTAPSSPAPSTPVKITPSKFALRFEPLTIALYYKLLNADDSVIDTRLHLMSLPFLKKDSDPALVCAKLFQQHPDYLNPLTISVGQLKRLVLKLQAYIPPPECPAPLSPNPCPARPVTATLPKTPPMAPLPKTPTSNERYVEHWPSKTTKSLLDAKHRSLSQNSPPLKAKKKMHAGKTLPRRPLATLGQATTR